MSALDIALPSELKVPGRMSLPRRHPKDPFKPWGSSRELTQQCRGLVKGVDRGLLEDSGGHPPLQQVVNLHHSPEGVVLVELFARLSIGLAAVLEAGLSVHTYVYVDNNDMVKRQPNTTSSSCKLGTRGCETLEVSTGKKVGLKGQQRKTTGLIDRLRMRIEASGCSKEFWVSDFNSNFGR